MLALTPRSWGSQAEVMSTIRVVPTGRGKRSLSRLGLLVSLLLPATTGVACSSDDGGDSGTGGSSGSGGTSAGGASTGGGTSGGSGGASSGGTGTGATGTGATGGSDGGTCTSDDDCGRGTVCESTDPSCAGERRCVTGCREADDCDAGSTCEVIACFACPCPGTCSG